MAAHIQKFLAASRYAVVGASTNRAKYGNKVLRCLLANDKVVYPVHPTEEEIEGIRCLKSLSDVPDLHEVSVSVITPPAVSAGVLEEAKRLGVKNIWFQPGAEPANMNTAGPDMNVIGNGDCILVALNFDEH